MKRNKLNKSFGFLPIYLFQQTMYFFSATNFIKLFRWKMPVCWTSQFLFMELQWLLFSVLETEIKVSPTVVASAVYLFENVLLSEQMV